MAPIRNGTRTRPESLVAWHMSHRTYERRVAHYREERSRLRDVDELLARLWAVVDLMAEGATLGEGGTPPLLAGLMALTNALERVSRIELRLREAGPTRQELESFLTGIVDVIHEFVAPESTERAVTKIAGYAASWGAWSATPEVVPLAGSGGNDNSPREIGIERPSIVVGRPSLDPTRANSIPGIVSPPAVGLRGESPRALEGGHPTETDAPVTCRSCRSFDPTTKRCARNRYFVAPTMKACDAYQATASRVGMQVLNSVPARRTSTPRKIRRPQ